MKFSESSCRLAVLAMLACTVMGAQADRSAGAIPSGTNEIRIVELQGKVDLSPANANAWSNPTTNSVLHPFDRLRTGPHGRLALRWSDQTIIPVGPSTLLEVLPPHEPGADSGLHLIEGILSFFHRDKPGRIRIIARGAVAGVEGTEFVVEAAPADSPEHTTISIIDGQVRFGNDYASLVLTNGQQAVIDGDRPPVITAGFVVNNLLQWAFYYPAVLDPADLELTTPEQEALAASLAAYRSGDLLAALAQYPADRTPSSDSDRLFHAALLLSVGQVPQAESFLAAFPATDTASRSQKLAAALRRLIDTVKNETGTAPSQPTLTTELLAESYAAQAHGKRGQSLEVALALAEQAASKSPGFGFSWSRVAELEFSFGRTRTASASLDKALELSPRNSQARSLRGFLLAAQSRPREAIAWFDAAIAADSALANAWLGRGLTRIRCGESAAGREDLLIAAALEPRRAELRNYLGKAFADDGQDLLATREVRIAKELDPNDPNTWLYSALLHQQHNEVNAAIRDLEKSQVLNGNRSLFRSDSLLNEDAAVRSANLARVYQDAGLADVALREAARAVNTDYANYAGHQFLAESYNWSLRNLSSQRFETAVANEYTLANLLAPVHAGILSSAISQSEYSSLFERNRTGVYSSSEYFDRGAWDITGGQYGVFDTFSYNLFGAYYSDPGQYPNNEILSRSFTAQIKFQLTPQDSLYLDISTLNLDSGQRAQVYDPTPRPVFPALSKSKETQQPIVSVGLNHEWSQGIHTLFMFTRLNDNYHGTNSSQASIVLVHPGQPPFYPVDGAFGFGASTVFWNDSDLYSMELQQIWQQANNTTIAGARFQTGSFHSFNSDDPNVRFIFGFFDPQSPWADRDVTTQFRRASAYLYHHWQILDDLKLIGGLTYDWIDYPDNIWSSPVTDGQKTKDQLSPKAGLIWTPLRNTAVRFAFTRSLQGASIDQSIQLEPSQIAGFVQTFRSIAPESVVGGNPAARFETFDLSLEQNFDTGTYLSLAGQLLSSRQNRTVGAYQFYIDYLLDPVAEGIQNKLDYQERSLTATLNQLLGDDWSVGSSYRLSQGELDSHYPAIPDTAFQLFIQSTAHRVALLHHTTVFALFNHPSGFFAGIDGNWYSQSNSDYTPDLPGDSLWQGNLHVGYRFLRRRAEVRFSLLNFTDQDYRLNPLNLYNNLPRDRTFAVRVQFGF
jgi:Tfp pilus assembly protein PilF